MNEHGKTWGILKYQEKKHKREKAVLCAIIAVLFAIIIVLTISLVLSNIIWYARHNNETANAEPVLVQTVAVASAPIIPQMPHHRRDNKKGWVKEVCLT